TDTRSLKSSQRYLYMNPSQTRPSHRTAVTSDGPERRRTYSRVPSGASASDSSTGASTAGFGLFVVTDVVHARDLLDLEPGHLPGALNDPRQRAIKPCRFVFDLLQHGLGEVE